MAGDKQTEHKLRKGAPASSALVPADRLDAVLFNMDGVVTDTANAHTARSYPGTVRLIHRLAGGNVKIGLFTSRRNADDVLQSAGVADLFPVRVDGAQLDRLGLPGKPDPAMMIATAKQLAAAPARAVVVEDSVAGVAAGRAGGFACVIGVDRGGNAEALQSRGADVVVGDLGEIDYRPAGGLELKTTGSLPTVWECAEPIRARLENNELAVFLDYDGTLTPIVEDFTKAFLGEPMRRSVAALAGRTTVVIVSGRDLSYLKDLVGLGNVYYAGSHGFDIAGPEAWQERFEEGVAFLPELAAAERELGAAVAAIDGAAIERKRFSIAVHFRRVADAQAAAVGETVERVLAAHPRLRLGHGKKVFEILPRIDWNKGRALEWLLNKLRLNRPGVVALYVGDDITDEDAFRRLPLDGLGIVVRDGERKTSADYALADCEEVRRFLDMLAGLTRRAAP